MNKKDFNDVKALVELIQIHNENNLKELSNIVSNIIKYKLKDENTIEHTLDNLLDLTYEMGEGVKTVYYKLLNYYKNINLEASKDYEKYYLEIINEETKLPKR